jgi:hypothetical protein
MMEKEFPKPNEKIMMGMMKEDKRRIGKKQRSYLLTTARSPEPQTR